METLNKKYFLAANSAAGFYSAFDGCYDPQNGWTAYIIKGGPGTGKSSFLKFMAVNADNNGLSAELCPCTSDPNSLDGIIIPELKTVFLDGTSPHTVEPKYPGVCENLLDFGKFWNPEMLRKNRKEITELTDENKRLHRTASGYLAAYGKIMSDDLKTASACTDKAHTVNYAFSLCKKNIPVRTGTGIEQKRFIQGVTPLGVVSYPKTVSGSYENIAVISDEYSSVSAIINEIVRNYALGCGYDVITLRNPFMPNDIIDHVLIPELSFAVVTENRYMDFDVQTRRVHSRRFVSSNKLHNSRGRLKFNAKLKKDILLSAASVMAQAKSVHDELEKYYAEAMDFSALTQFAEGFAEEFFTDRGF